MQEGGGAMGEEVLTQPQREGLPGLPGTRELSSETKGGGALRNRMHGGPEEGQVQNRLWQGFQSSLRWQTSLENFREVWVHPGKRAEMAAHLAHAPRALYPISGGTETP